MSFVNAHFVTYVQDLGYHKMVAAGAFSLIGAAAIIGALLLGHLSDQHGRRKILAMSYHLRGLGFILVLLSMGIPFLNVPSLGIPALLVGIIMVGFSWNAPTTITAAYTADRFGMTQLGTIFGAMFAVMPLGSGLGAYLGGLLYDAQGIYAIGIWSNIALLFLAGGTIFSIKERLLPGARATAAS
jgi:MFS family permease